MEATVRMIEQKREEAWVLMALAGLLLGLHYLPPNSTWHDRATTLHLT